MIADTGRDGAVAARSARGRENWIELLSADTAAMSALPFKTDVISPAGYIG